MTDKKKKVELTTECKAGKHKFIVTAWFNKGGQQKATTMRCQYCLIPLDMEEMHMREWSEENGINQ